MTNVTKPRVVVVGGGLAGVAASIECLRAGTEVVLLEKRSYLGGATWSFSRGGLRFDNGQHVFMRCCSAYRSLLSSLGVTHMTTLQPRLDIPVLRPGRRPSRLWRSSMPVPFHLAGSLLRYSPLSHRERLVAARLAWQLSRIDPTGPEVDDLSFGEWLTAHAGRSTAGLDALWDPILRATCNLAASECSLAMAAKVVGTGLFESSASADLGWSRVPLSELHDVPARALLGRLGASLRIGTPVDRVERDLSGKLSVTAGAEKIDADAVILAVPHTSLEPLLPEGVGVGPLQGLGTSAIVNVQIVYDRTVTSRAVAACLESPLQWIFDRSEAVGLTRPEAGSPGGGPPGPRESDPRQCLGISMSAADELLPLRPADLARTVEGELARLLPGARGATVLDSVVTKEREATFAPRKGTSRLRPGPVTSAPGLILAGSWTSTGWPATMEGAVRSGITAANAALATVGHTRALPMEVPA